MKTAIYVILLVVGLLILTVYLLFNSLPDDMCGNTIKKEIESPNKKHKVVIFTRDCGATTHYSTQLSIIEAGEKLENANGNILILDYEPQVEAIWESDNKLIIRHDSTLKTYKEKDSFDDIEISYLNLKNTKPPSKKDTIILKTPNGHFINLGKEDKNYYVEWLQDNQLIKLDSAFSGLEKGHSWTPRFQSENKNYIVLRAGCGSPCWIGIFLPLFKEGKPIIINEYIAYDLNSDLVASVVDSDSIEVFNLRTFQKKNIFLGKCKSAFIGNCIDTAYFKTDKLIYEWTSETVVHSKKLERREVKIK